MPQKANIRNNIVDTRHFIQATRDAGYKSTASALAELIDNSIEANATKIDIILNDTNDGIYSIEIIDNGYGMNEKTLRAALRFGGSDRFNKRSGIGRFGMGLPNSSLSQARRVEVYTWQNPTNVWMSCLDIDEVANQGIRTSRVKDLISPTWREDSLQSGTVVIWSKCDRVEYRSRDRFISKLRMALGRVYRKKILSGLNLTVCGERIEAIDPMLVRPVSGLAGRAKNMVNRSYMK